MAAAVAFLTSDDASLVSGVDLTVDGGCLAAVGLLVAEYLASGT